MLHLPGLLVPARLPRWPRWPAIGQRRSATARLLQRRAGHAPGSRPRTGSAREAVTLQKLRADPSLASLKEPVSLTCQSGSYLQGTPRVEQTKAMRVREDGEASQRPAGKLLPPWVERPREGSRGGARRGDLVGARSWSLWQDPETRAAAATAGDAAQGLSLPRAASQLRKGPGTMAAGSAPCTKQSGSGGHPSSRTFCKGPIECACIRLNFVLSPTLPPPFPRLEC